VYPDYRQRPVFELGDDPVAYPVQVVHEISLGGVGSVEERLVKVSKRNYIWRLWFVSYARLVWTPCPARTRHERDTNDGPTSHACWYIPAVESPAPGWLKELTWRTEPPWLTMGTRALRDTPLFEPAGPESKELRRRKEQLLRSAHDEVSVALPAPEGPGHDGRGLERPGLERPGLESAVNEVAQLVSRLAGARLDEEWPPLEAAALLVPDDLVVLVRQKDRWVMAAGVVCFPSHWSPPDKLGLPVAAIHGPVPRYADELRHRVDRFLDQLSVNRAVWRRNWTIHASPELHAPRLVPTAGPLAPPNHWLRSERQVLAVLPQSSGILFTIRTDQVPLAILKEQPELAMGLAGALRATPPDLAAYRFGALDTHRLANWLEGQEPS
jgi:dimethylamine monooxygenase subunit A